MTNNKIYYVCDRLACSDKYGGICYNPECFHTSKKEHAVSLINGKKESELKLTRIGISDELWEAIDEQ